jgi:hypothetical protein
VSFCSQQLADSEPNMQGRVSVVVAPPAQVDRYKVEDPGGTKLTLISSDDHVKGVDRFLEFAQKLPDHDFLLVTDTEYRDLPKNVELRARSRDVRSVYADTKLLLLPSRNDSAPRVIFEAAISGIPTLASDLIGVHQASFGLTRVVRDDDSWPEAIEGALADFDSLRKDATAIAKRRLDQQATQLDTLWQAMRTIASVRDALLSLVMIVKNEASGIRATLEAVRPAIDYWTIVDTGSDDGTPEIINEVLADIPGKLHHAPFVDFATTRNLALELAEPHARFQLMLSGDEVVQDAAALAQFCLEA